MITLLLLGLLLLATSVVLAARALAPRASEPVERIQAYGFGAETVGLPRDVDPSSRAAKGVLARFGEWVSGRFGRISPSDMRRELMAAGMYRTSPAQLLGFRVIVAAAVGALLLVVAAAASERQALLVVLAIIATVIAWMLPLAVVRRRARERHARIDRALPDLIDLLVVTIEAGLGFNGSLRVAAREMSGPLADELRLTLQEEAMGLSVTDALTNLLARVETPAMRSFVRSVVQGESLGVSIGAIMRNIAVEMRKRRRHAAEERAQKAPVKMLFPLVFLIFPAIFIVLLLPALLQLQDTFS